MCSWKTALQVLEDICCACESKLMQQLSGRAGGTLSGADISALGFEWFKSLRDLLQFDNDSSALLDHPHWGAFWNLSRRPYLNRVWIVQEMRLANEPVFVSADIIFMAQVLRALGTRPRFEELFSEGKIWDVQLERLKRSATDMRDHVYGVLRISSLSLKWITTSW
ncbi:hypothetical protein N657DRAFT_632215 [Parathielavia appendiculata]|uniref:Heterokaryon incompatibility domain-containing protein n=1 Tax=Parathielavia appendiculata TaxID=2587402 RepID=A0AAN6U4Y4_9PEZI|nr:hypothetical protein N657DRAFT_632215 [Parathielavia appendiculata]